MKKRKKEPPTWKWWNCGWQTYSQKSRKRVWAKSRVGIRLLINGRVNVVKICFNLQIVCFGSYWISSCKINIHFFIFVITRPLISKRIPTRDFAQNRLRFIREYVCHPQFHHFEVGGSFFPFFKAILIYFLKKAQCYVIQRLITNSSV